MHVVYCYHHIILWDFTRSNCAVRWFVDLLQTDLTFFLEKIMSHSTKRPSPSKRVNLCNNNTSGAVRYPGSCSVAGYLHIPTYIRCTRRSYCTALHCTLQSMRHAMIVNHCYAYNMFYKTIKVYKIIKFMWIKWYTTEW